MYRPEQWVLIKITGTDPHYRVFGSWRGGFATSDEWRLNSGIVRVEEDNDFYYFYGHSGSCYQCYKKSYGTDHMGLYNTGSIEEYCKNSGGLMEIIPDMPNVMEMEWIIK
jgi:hypothetical protein